MTTTQTKSAEKKVKIRLPLLPGKHASQDVFVALNFKTYRIKRGEEVEIPESVYNVIVESQQAQDAEILAKQKMAIKEPAKQ